MTTALLVILFVFIGLLIGVMFLFLKKTVIKINQQSKDYFVDKLQVYDELIIEKEKKLKGLNEKLEIKQKEIDDSGESKEVVQDVYLYDLKNINYQDDKVFEKMKDIENRFNINNVGLVKKFIKNNFTEEPVLYYNRLIETRDKLNQDLIYKMVSKSSLEQEEVVRGLLAEDSGLLDDFKKKNKRFNILKFTFYFDKIIDKADPYVYVYVGNENENFDDIHPFVRTKVDKAIYKGIFIVYRGKLYDYSLK